MVTVPATPLPHGVAAPSVGLGTWQLRGSECERVVTRALELGYRHIDTAEGYGNERDVGRAIRGLERTTLFITSKAWRDNLEPADLRSACEGSLRRLGTDYLDLLLIHWPNSAIPIRRTIDGMHGLREDGLIRAWGVSNFTPTHLADAAEVELPATNQVELHPFFQQRSLRSACARLGVPITAYTPLAKGRVLDHPVLAAIGRGHGRSPAQVALRWSLQHGHLVIPKASSDAHLRANLKTFDFTLSTAEMQRIDGLPQAERMVDGEWSEFDRSPGATAAAEGIDPRH